MDKTYAPIENKPHEKIKVESIDIVVPGPKEKPYYSIKYRKVGSNDDCIGYGSYSLEYVLEWIEQCFELVDCRIRMNMSCCHSKIIQWQRSDAMKKMMKAVHSIREMMKNHIQAMEYLSMHGCHCRNHTRRNNEDNNIHHYRLHALCCLELMHCRSKCR